jgi:hypothetical protein
VAPVGSSTPSSGRVDVDDGVDVDVEVGADGYGPREELAVEELQAGDLVLVEESTQQWAVVEVAEPDILDEGCICVDWRSDDDDLGSLSLPEQSPVTARHPAEAGT